MSSRSVRHLRRLTGLVLLWLFAAATPSAWAGFHLWQAQEVFSNSSGSVQFIELRDNFSGENFVNGFTLTANSDGVIKTFTFPADLNGETSFHSLLIASSNFATFAGSVTPDFTLEQGGATLPFFNPNATNITITFTGSGDSLSFTGASLPKDGVNSLNDINLYGPQNLVPFKNSPTNFSGQSGSVNIPEPGAAVTLLSLPLFALFRRRGRR